MKYKKVVLSAIGFISGVYILLLIPFETIDTPTIANKKQFIWNRDSFWNFLETTYAEAKKKDCSQLNKEILKSLVQLNSEINNVAQELILPSDKRLSNIEDHVFYTAALIGACQQQLPIFTNLFSKIRNVIKEKSINWNLEDLTTRQTLYKLIYGGRAAVEELILQADKNKISTTILGKKEESFTPAVMINGMEVHSGDILVSRGGAPTSALIARGNDYPGNFSHVALVYVDEQSGKTYIIESHIERGVTLSSIDDYLKDKKLRIMVLRLRIDHPKMKVDNLIPHKAAKLAFERASEKHIAYDFEMNYKDNTKLFCSEVASSVYKEYGIKLWMGMSSISSQGVANWLAGFGVKNFITQEPSDLEYDPQLTVIAEWRDAVTLFKDHLDNAIIDAMLEQSELGKKLNYDWYLLPVARTMKLYSTILNLFGKVGPIPEGMNPESALRHKKLVALHEIIKSGVEAKTKSFINQMNYNPPYWKLVSFAREVISEMKLF